MKARPLGSTGLRVSEVGLGCWALGSADIVLAGQPNSYASVPSEEAHRIVRTALDAGVTFFDTADVYGLGKGERLLASALGADRKRVVLATKGGYIPDGEVGMATSVSKRHILDACEQSLKRLATDWIDLYQLHLPPSDAEMDGAREAVETLKKEGKIRAAGFSVANRFDRGAEILRGKDNPFQTIQCYYNIVLRQAEADLLPLARERGIGVIVASPLSRGLLSGRYGAETSFAGTDIRRGWNTGESQRTWFETNVRKTDSFRNACAAEGILPAAAALRFVLDHPAVSTAIPGAREAGQAAANAAVSDLPPLPASVRAAAETIR